MKAKQIKINDILRIGTDCSGIEAPIQALQQLGIPFQHVFASDIDKYCIQSIKANYNPDILFGDKDGPFPEGDITERDMSLVPDLDLYVCGFPCQPFSQAGSRKGLEDKRGNVFWSCLDLIKTKQPKYFILENVRGILSHDKGKTWNIIWQALKDLEKYGYSVDWKLLNTREYGIPQNRPRVFIVGTTDQEFIWPEKIEMDDIKNYVDWNDTTRNTLRKTILENNCLEKVPKHAVFVDFNFIKITRYQQSNKYSPCIMADSRTWCIPLHRFANVKERLLLQGFSADFIQVVSNTQMKKQIGNSMSVNVLKKIIEKIIN